MKKIIAFFSVLALIFSVPAVFAQMPVAMPAAALSSGLERIGVVGAAAGKVELTTPGQVGRIAQSGQPVFLGDLVNTDAKGHLQILLLDETVFTIGPNSAITIDKFIYDPKSQAGEIKASVAKGVFRYVSGKIAVKNPSKVTVKLPTATLGFRGTIVGGSIGTDGQGLVGLLGPGNNNDAGAQTGSFTVEGQGGDQQGVNRTGFGVEIGEGGGLSGVFQLTQDQINNLTQGLGGHQGGGGMGGQGNGLGGNTNMGDLSGETGALTGDNVGLTEGLNDLNNGLTDLTTVVSQDKLSNDTGTSTGDTTTYEELRTAITEPSHYAGTGSYANGGSMFAQANIVFGSDGFIGGQNAYLSINSGGAHGSDFTSIGGEGGTRYFSEESGPATFAWNETGSFGDFNITVTLLNSDGVTAGQAKVDVTYLNTYGELGPISGTGTATVPLASGELEQG